MPRFRLIHLIDVPSGQYSRGKRGFGPELLQFRQCPSTCSPEGNGAHDGLDQLLLKPFVNHFLDDRS